MRSGSDSQQPEKMETAIEVKKLVKKYPASDGTCGDKIAVDNLFQSGEIKIIECGYV